MSLLNLASILLKMKIINFVMNNNEMRWSNALTGAKSTIVPKSVMKNLVPIFENVHVLHNVHVSKFGNHFLLTISFF